MPTFDRSRSQTSMRRVRRRSSATGTATRVKPRSRMAANGRSPRRIAQSGRRMLATSRKSAKRRPKPAVAARVPRLRLMMVFGVLAFGAVGLMLNLVRLQVFQANDLREQARAQQTLYVKNQLPRRPVVDVRGNTVAIDRPVYTLYAHPRLFKESKAAIAEAIAPIVNQPSQSLYELFNTGESGIEVAYTVIEDSANRLRRLRIDGLELIERQQRLYPQEDLMAEIVGYVNAEQQGQSGVEYSQQQALQRRVRDRGFALKRTGDGSILPENLPPGFPYQDDLTLKLTVDSNLQRIVRDTLRKQMQEFSAKRGAVIVMDVHSGAIRALVSEPTYNPNEYYKFDLERMRNWIVTDAYEPGSTFKPINVAIALESGKVQPTESFNDEGQIYVGEWPIQNNDYSYSGARGMQTLTEIVQYSSNVGMVRLMQRLSAEEYYRWIQKIGLGRITGIDLPFEAAGYVKDKELFLNDPIEPATTAFGQGFSLTPIQLAQLHSSLANGGFLVTPHVVQGLYNDQQQLYWQPSLPAPKRVFSAKTTQAVLPMMEAVVEDGTGKIAQINGYRIAGKTGTAQKASAQGGYLANARITSFVALFPSDAPRYAVLVVVDEPKGDNAYGSTVAAPITKVVMETLISTEGIQPSVMPSSNLSDEDQ
ncbi:peptidoglycan D,D-transpeptidase FtsI family protein [Leptolyngbya sp. AN02str]|uniref:peptidoglycan D,D-transpeptidase FtsI family protein n=1 Tax=Leptolyngbya sp. AN02str TaxID=3423363 RepID=UPI003D31BCCE